MLGLNGAGGMGSPSGTSERRRVPSSRTPGANRLGYATAPEELEESLLLSPEYNVGGNADEENEDDDSPGGGGEGGRPTALRLGFDELEAEADEEEAEMLVGPPNRFHFSSTSAVFSPKTHHF